MSPKIDEHLYAGKTTSLIVKAECSRQTGICGEKHGDNSRAPHTTCVLDFLAVAGTYPVQIDEQKCNMTVDHIDKTWLGVEAQRSAVVIHSFIFV